MTMVGIRDLTLMKTLEINIRPMIATIEYTMKSENIQRGPSRTGR